MTGTIEKLKQGKDLSLDEMHGVMLQIMKGEVSEKHLADLLIALKNKGETEQEIAGSALAMRDMSVKLELRADMDPVDVCGTGGDESGTFNISTAAAFVVAGAGIKVAKHGNRSISSKSGSADVLRELGCNINMAPRSSASALEETSITFMFAPEYHPAMKHVAPVRRELATKTIFNMLGPLTNPAGTRRQLIGTYNTQAAEKMAAAAAYLNMERICFICTDGRFDEVTLSGLTEVIEYTTDGSKKWTVGPATFGYPELELKQISGESAEQNAQTIRDIFSSHEKTPAFYVTAANAAMGLYSAGFASDLNECQRAAEDAILSGKAQRTLDHFIEFGRGK